jgi:hypothetical protein
MLFVVPDFLCTFSAWRLVFAAMIGLWLAPTALAGLVLVTLGVYAARAWRWGDLGA